MPEGSLWEPELWEVLQRGRGNRERCFYQKFQGTEMLPVQPVLEMSLWINCPVEQGSSASGADTTGHQYLERYL